MSEYRKRWRLRLICCERDDGIAYFQTWEMADRTRQSYMNVPGTLHRRVAILEENDDE